MRGLRADLATSQADLATLYPDALGHGETSGSVDQPAIKGIAGSQASGTKPSVVSKIASAKITAEEGDVPERLGARGFDPECVLTWHNRRHNRRRG